MIGFLTMLDTTLISEDSVSTTVSEISTTVSEVSSEVAAIAVVAGLDNSFWSQLFVSPPVTMSLIFLGLNLVCHVKFKILVRKCL